MTQLLGYFSFFTCKTCARQLDWLSFLPHRMCTCPAPTPPPPPPPPSMFSCLPLMKRVLHKPKQAAATTIISSESTHWSDTLISSPVGDREHRGGHYKNHIAGRARPARPSPAPRRLSRFHKGDHFHTQRVEACSPSTKVFFFFIVFFFTSLRRSVGSTIAREKARTRTGAWAHSHAPVRRLTFSGHAVISAP